jgi:hypothetical protein
MVFLNTTKAMKALSLIRPADDGPMNPLALHHQRRPTALVAIATARGGCGSLAD